MQNTKTLFLLRPLIVPAGTEFGPASVKTTRVGEGHVEATIGLSKDTSGSLTYFAGEPGSIERTQLDGIFSEFPDPRPPHIVRVDHEEQELNNLFYKLRDLLSTPSRLKQFGLLGTQEHERLLAQSFFMEGYLTTLRDRLDAAEGRLVTDPNTTVPRRNDRNRMTEHELVLTAVMHYLEATPGNARFTTALTCVSEARAQLADLADGVPPTPEGAGGLGTVAGDESTLRDNNADAALLTRGAATAKAKSLRKALDEVLQEAKDHLSAMKLLSDYGDDTSEAIAQHIISIRELESAIMRQGMVLKAIGATNPYPESKNPDSPVIEPTADGLKL